MQLLYLFGSPVCRELQNPPNMYEKHLEIIMKSQFAAFLRISFFFPMAIFIMWGKKTLKGKTKVANWILH